MPSWLSVCGTESLAQIWCAKEALDACVIASLFLGQLELALSPKYPNLSTLRVHHIFNSYHSALIAWSFPIALYLNRTFSDLLGKWLLHRLRTALHDPAPKQRTPRDRTTTSVILHHHHQLLFNTFLLATSTCCRLHFNFTDSSTQKRPYDLLAMAPPPPATLPLQERVLQLAQTLQFAWFVGHVTLLITAVRYALSYITFHSYTKWARFSYRTAFVAAAATYGIVVFKSFRARARSGKPQGGALTIVGDENVQYLGKFNFRSAKVPSRQPY